MLFYYFMITLFHFYFRHMFNFFTLIMVLFFGVNCFCFHTFSEHPFFAVSFFNWISIQQWWFLFFTNWVGRYLSKFDCNEFWSSLNMLSIVLNFSQLSSFEKSWPRKSFVVQLGRCLEVSSSFLRCCIQICFPFVFPSNYQETENKDQIYMFFLTFNYAVQLQKRCRCLILSFRFLV